MEVEYRNPSPSPSPSPSSSSSFSSSAAVGRRLHPHSTEDDGGDAVACTGKRCQSCTAGVIADCVAVCCCPCAVVNFLTLTFLKLPWAVARRCIGRRKRKKQQQRRRRSLEGADRHIRVALDEYYRSSSSDDQRHHQQRFSVELKVVEDAWLDLYEFGHLGFGRVSFTGIPFQNTNK